MIGGVRRDDPRALVGWTVARRLGAVPSTCEDAAMDEQFWNERYSEPGFAYGSEPNDFVRESAAHIPPGPVLCLADGEGRNGVFLAGRGHDVTAVDLARVGLDKAEQLARERNVRLTTVCADLSIFQIAPASWSGIVSVWVHLPSDLRRRVHAACVAGLAPGGAFLIEAYAPRQLGMGTGGPTDPDRYVTLAALQSELRGLEFEVAREVEREIEEGRYHHGRSVTLQILARRPRR
jgi:SAM-dependent methyltransferase